jgi:hypothetical protein
LKKLDDNFNNENASHSNIDNTATEIDKIVASVNENSSEEDIKNAIAHIDDTIALINEKLATPPPVKGGAISRATKGKLLFAIISIFIITFTTIFTTFAWFTKTVNSETNTITSGVIKIDFVNAPPVGESGSSGTELDPIRILPGYIVNRDVYVNNKGTMPLYVRLKTEIAITLLDKYSQYSNSVDPSIVIFNIADTSWQKKDGYYYYSSPLLAGQSTPKIFSEIKFSETMSNIYKGSMIKIKFIFEIVQSNNNGENVFEAEGWATDTEGGRL